MREELMKKEIQEKTKEINEQLRQLSSESNPFDEMLHHATEILRNCLFDCSRFNNKDLPENFRSNRKSTERLFEKIMTIYSELEGLSPEAAEVCRMTSGPMQDWETFNKINDGLIEFSKKYETEYSQYSPIVNEDFLIFKLGKDSEEFKHLIRLRILTTTRFKKFTSDDFSKMMDVLDNSEEICKNNFMMSEKTFHEYSSAIIEENLDDKDIQYMKRWKEISHENPNYKTFKVRKTSGEIFEVIENDSYLEIRNKLFEILKNKGLFFQGMLSEKEFNMVYKLIIDTSMEYMKYEDSDTELCDFLKNLIEPGTEQESDYKVFQINQILSIFCMGYAKAEKKNDKDKNNIFYHFIYYR